MIAKRASWTLDYPTSARGTSITGYIQGFVQHSHLGTVAIMLVTDSNRKYVEHDFVEVPLKNLRFLPGDR